MATSFRLNLAPVQKTTSNLAWFALFLTSSIGNSQDATIPGEPTASFPTYENLSIDWTIEGDDNENGTVLVRYRALGDADWKKALPLFRVPAGSNCGFLWKNRHSGSLFGLTPNTSYEIELALNDPDGGSQIETLVASTKQWPESSKQGVLVDPQSIAIKLTQLKAGDVLLLQKGEYNEFRIPHSGSMEKPIVIRADSPHEAIINGDVRIDGKAHVHVIGLKINGKVKFNNANNVMIRECKITTANDGIVAYGSEVSEITVVENHIHGPSQWKESSLGTNGDNLGEGIVVTGSGHVIANNLVEGFRDGISLVEDKNAHNQRSIDIYRNDIYHCCDDGIEADFAMGNVRVYENRLTDCFMGISSQPSLGGPTYFIRNEIYNAVLQGFKLQRSSVGDIGFHNTVVKSGDAFSVNTRDVWSRAWFCNNLFIGSPGSEYNGYHSGAGRLLYIPSAAENCKFEFNGFGSMGTDRIEGNFGGKRISAKELSEQHNQIVDLQLFDKSVKIPDPLAQHPAQNFELSEDSIVIDRGKELFNVNDGFNGQAPDLGAIELGADPIHYGPSSSVKSGQED